MVDEGLFMIEQMMSANSLSLFCTAPLRKIE